jgi:hypothetical protein
MKTTMKRALMICGVVLLTCSWSLGQMDNRDGQGVRGEGTINDMSDDPQQNQRLTGNMGTTTGSTYNAGASDHSNDLGGQSASSGASAGQPDKVPPQGTGIKDKGQPITSSPGASAATNPTERVRQQRSQKNVKDLSGQKGATSNEPVRKKSD